MYLKLMYLTNDPKIAIIAEKAGVDRVFIDLEFVGKELRQGHLDTVISRHEIEDIASVRKVLNHSELLVRVNPIYSGSKEEIDSVIESGADIVMLPYFKTLDEVNEFIGIVDGRAKVNLLVETAEAVDIIDDILKIKGIDEIHIGLNDLHLSKNMTFMFELLADGTVEMLCNKFKAAKISYGFGGIARVGLGMLPAENIICEHYRLGSTCVILSRSFCDVNKIDEDDKIQWIFKAGVRQIRECEQEYLSFSDEQFEENRKEVAQKVNNVVEHIKLKK